MKKKGKPVGLWVRVSTDLQIKADSPANQIQRLRDFVRSKGWKEVTLYQLDGVSGAISLSHPEAKRMERDLEMGTIKALVATRFARVARDGIMFRQLYRRMKDLGAELISLDENIDTSTPAGELMVGFMADLAEMERKEISSRVKASVKTRAKAGKKLGGEAPFGYQWKDGAVVIHPAEAPVRKLVHELFIELKRKKAVARELNERGYKTRLGRAWSDTTIDWMLRDPIAKGLHRVNYVQSNGPGKKWSFKSDEEVIYRDVPAIVSPEVWDEALSILEEQGRVRARKSKPAKHLFSGLVICGCGNKMYVKSGRDKYVCYTCNQKVLKSTVEEAFLRRLRHQPVDTDTLTALLSGSDEELQDTQELLKNRVARERQVEREIKKCITLNEQRKLNDIAFTRMVEPLQIELKQLQDEVPLIEAKVLSIQGRQIDPVKLLGENATLADVWGKLDFEGRRMLVEALVIRILVEQGGKMHLTLAHNVVQE